MRSAKTLFATLTLMSLSSLAQAQGTPLFPTLGVTGLQTMRLNVVAVPPSPCVAILGFSDSNGAPVGGTLSVNLNTGQSASLDIAGNTLVRGLGQRVQVRPTITPNEREGGGADTCAATTEVFDTLTGVDRVLVNGLPAVQVPPSPAFGMLGLGLFQTARLNVVATPPNPCVGTLSFADAAGNPVGSFTRVGLAAGQAGSLDLNGNGLVRGLGQRVEVRPVFTPEGGSCQVSAEVFEQITGSTLVQDNPGPPDTGR